MNQNINLHKFDSDNETVIDNKSYNLQHSIKYKIKQNYKPRDPMLLYYIINGEIS